ncbi:hypothetical protein KC19_VG133800 [Ceratodon purpureus]|uniref:Uncharacterized protein n=1 Tax=Ceratodon purpureus TaxID=3225 RepID=A0A8T0HPT3_CERPU|nr:hypothetical protein KC19_VG133800 [Ceratodon purpureus]
MLSGLEMTSLVLGESNTFMLEKELRVCGHRRYGGAPSQRRRTLSSHFGAYRETTFKSPRKSGITLKCPAGADAVLSLGSSKVLGIFPFFQGGV